MALLNNANTLRARHPKYIDRETANPCRLRLHGNRSSRTPLRLQRENNYRTGRQNPQLIAYWSFRAFFRQVKYFISTLPRHACRQPYFYAFTTPWTVFALRPYMHQTQNLTNLDIKSPPTVACENPLYMQTKFQKQVLTYFPLLTGKHFTGGPI